MASAALVESVLKIRRHRFHLVAQRSLHQRPQVLQRQRRRDLKAPAVSLIVSCSPSPELEEISACLPVQLLGSRSERWSCC